MSIWIILLIIFGAATVLWVLATAFFVAVLAAVARGVLPGDKP